MSTTFDTCKKTHPAIFIADGVIYEWADGSHAEQVRVEAVLKTGTHGCQWVLVQPVDGDPSFTADSCQLTVAT